MHTFYIRREIVHDSQTCDAEEAFADGRAHAVSRSYGHRAQHSTLRT
jgi:hypothetical protein